ncbi:hypothetical protein CMEL01_09762 [Colletotrichum melonis]|uniref:ubiquitinyl hydrolase 1 n=1 Tax=Colletotrichum melonis TaxID=1209925 RepID=A0AAI9U074_9PEZI|nr:hypothetical protein CMEL01_09762 [Colletotrichum melonis]
MNPLLVESPAAVHGALFSHLAMPAKLPQQRDPEKQIQLIESELVQRLAAAAKIMSELPGNADQCRDVWDSVGKTLGACQHLNAAGQIDKAILLRELHDLGPSGCIVLHIEKQNAGLIIRRAQDPIFNDSVVFEAFEASAKNEQVLATEGALLWDFPGIAVAIPFTTFADQHFQSSLATFIEQASLETVKDFAAHAFKTGTSVFEYRNTGDPSIITSLLMAILEENGRRVAPVLLRKRVRDEICWDHAKRPWRRLPYYLILRVCIERFLCVSLSPEQGRLEYKFFMCVLLSTFLDATITFQASAENVHFLKKKICRRLVKVDLDRSRSQDRVAVSRYDFLFNRLNPTFTATIDKRSYFLHRVITQTRKSLTKQIPTLPRKAPFVDMQLGLRASYEYIKKVILSNKAPRRRRRYREIPGEGPVEAPRDHLSHYAQRYHKLINTETELLASTKDSCTQISQQIFDYIHTAAPLYEGNAEQNSQMLLTVMELWIKMDSIACASFPLLTDFHPMFYPQMLDVLLLPQLGDMRRLSMLQDLLSARVKNASASRRNIFEDPSPGCFAERYYKESSEGSVLKDLHGAIIELASNMRDQKQREWKKKSKEYDELISRIDISACTYIFDEHNPQGRGYHDRNCARCSMMEKAQSMRINIFEDPLPSDPVVARAVIFELVCPKEFAAYRDTTWWLLRHLATHFDDQGILPRCLLRDYLQLKSFWRPSQHKLGLASTTKPFHVTHYTSMPFPVEWEGGRDGVCRPNALKLGYFDESTSAWPGRVRFPPLFDHQVALTLPKSSPWSTLLETKAYSLSGPGPSSYEVVASQSSCPPGINNHEYLAMQTLMTGESQRWIVLLTELASTNLNFSSEVTMLLVTHLALQSGPQDNSGDFLRATHTIFRDESFCKRLLEQIQTRLETVQANWRETYQMDILITLLLRTFALTTTSPDQKGFSNIIRAREICLRWVEILRFETFRARDAETARRCQQYALWAAVLCKRTYVIHANQVANLDSLSLRTYIECCITVQDNLVVDVGALPEVLQHAVVSDMKLSYRLSPMVRKSIASAPDMFRIAIMTVWPEADGHSRTISSLQLESEWAICEIQGHDGWEERMQTVQYNICTGLLLVDNRPLGKLPKPPEHTEVLTELFGEQALLTRPSDMPGMDYTLTVKHHGYRIDIGYDGSSIVIRATKGQQYLQLIQRSKFKSRDALDLPGPLLNDCVHWLDLRSGKVLITPNADKWNIGYHNWILDVQYRSLRVPPSGEYGKFVINRHLGRIESAPEPMLLYMKAQLHAYTSSSFPDPLTERTGTEEALQWLRSGICQPWSPLHSGPIKVLLKIAQLTPQHEYYPTDLKVMKTDRWDVSLTEGVQHEMFRPIVEQILSISAELQSFALVDVNFGVLPPTGDLHLHTRARLRRQIYERSFDNSTDITKAVDCKYQSRDVPASSNQRHLQVLEIVKFLRTWPHKAMTTRCLAQQLSQNNLIGGFQELCEKNSLNDRLGIDIAANWGSLVKSCREQENLFVLMFMLAPISYGSKADLSLIKTLAAFAVYEELKAVELPVWVEYRDFQSNHAPQLDNLIEAIGPFKTPAPKNDADELKSFASAKQLRRMRDETAAWDLKANDDCRFLAKYLLEQWPCIEPGVADISKPLQVDIEAALSVVRVGWKHLYQNKDLCAHLNTVQSILDQHQSETNYEASCFIASEESFGDRLRGGEIPSLRSDLLRKTVPSPHNGGKTNFREDIKVKIISPRAGRLVEPSRHPVHIRQPIKLPLSATGSLGTNVLTPSWMSAKTTLLPSTGAIAELKKIVSNLSNSKSLPSEHPDWLLLEIEANLMIRPDQVDVVLATVSPASGCNSVLQMNMGQGKTSCIIPMVAAALADTKTLLLEARLGGLLNRQVRHIPFSRRTPTQENLIRAYRKVHRTIMKQAGVIVCQPEHNLSFMLSGLQRMVDNRMPEAGPMINVQSWLRTRCRDILDESDYTLAVRTQLIYPSGSQMTVDGHPHPWQVAQDLLRLVDRHLYTLAHQFPNSIEVIRRSGGGFPLLFFLRTDVEEALVKLLTSDVLRGDAGILQLQNLDAVDRLAVREFLLNERPRDATLQRIRHLCPDRPSVKQTVYLLRGILVNRILMMTLKKRWNVQYGLHPLRDPIAVPYHAKGVPSEQSEWGHPDVAILFTCLAFYYDGISVAQLTQSLEHLLKCDDPTSEYDKWTRSSARFPEHLKAWNSINVDDGQQLGEIWIALRYNIAAIDYFMNNFVFPQHAQQFRVKLQSNGWDIPLFSVHDTDQSTQAEQTGQRQPTSSSAMTTGFSGTNDDRTMLPLTITQDDLPGLSHTNAEVLTYLLHDRSRECHRVVRPRGARASEPDLLRELHRRGIRILIDAGAQILEMDNETLAKQWLTIDEKAAAALFFDQSNMPWIIQRSGRKTPLLASPYADDIGECLVYLDEAHTRGTDLKFPPSARGALTLGLNQSKDHTVQGEQLIQDYFNAMSLLNIGLTRPLTAAMRMRQLGTTQSVTFFAPPEVYQSIVDLHCKPHGATVNSSDVIFWLLDNTCDGIEQLQPLYYSQGMDFCRRMQAAIDNPDFVKDKHQRENYLGTIKQDEQHSLQKLYEPKRKIKGTGEFQAGSDAKIRAFVKELNKRRKAFQDTGGAVHASALQEVEQEREVAFEVETVRQVKKPYHYPALAFPGLHPEVESFATTGRIPAGAHTFVPAIKSLSKTAIGKKFKVSDRPSRSKLYVTTEFERTVKLNFDLTSDNFLRNVNWILWSRKTEVALIVIPEEAEILLSILKDSAFHCATNLITYAAPVTRKMLHFSDLNFFSVPSLPFGWKAPDWLKIELGIYGGRLYFEWAEYDQLCEFLGIDQSLPLLEYLDQEGSDSDSADTQSGEKHKVHVSANGLTARPLSFVQEWLAARRRGQDFMSTPMGFIAQGKTLQEDHPFFRQVVIENRDKLFAPIQSKGDDEEDNGDHHVDLFAVDGMGANEEDDSDAHEDEIEYNDSEIGSEVEED